MGIQTDSLLRGWDDPIEVDEVDRNFLPHMVQRRESFSRRTVRSIDTGTGGLYVVSFRWYTAFPLAVYIDKYDTWVTNCDRPTPEIRDMSELVTRFLPGNCFVLETDPLKALIRARADLDALAGYMGSDLRSMTTIAPAVDLVHKLSTGYHSPTGA